MEKFKVGDIVICPEDRGESEHKAKILSIGNEVHKTLSRGVNYVWVEVQRLDNHRKSIWQSNRLQSKGR